MGQSYRVKGTGRYLPKEKVDLSGELKCFHSMILLAVHSFHFIGRGSVFRSLELLIRLKYAMQCYSYMCVRDEYDVMVLYFFVFFTTVIKILRSLICPILTLLESCK